MIRAKFTEASADQLRSSAGVIRPPVPLEILAKHLAVRVLPDAKLKPRVRGAYDPASRTILVATLGVRAERFTLAHELGHLVLDHGGACSFEGEPSVGSFALEDADVRIDEEAEADDFAGRLLVPRSWLRDRVRSLSRDELLDTFDVNLPVLIIAAERYRLLNQISLA
ncbi:MAG TPA: ImmA/IrrE family metallo-endopeptidase [Candidatus Limnocylindrales bacterium]|nr:ImmA/IrrE family metallo-endopeptidase [Candidatus Limnocylindrales bacterium]